MRGQQRARYARRWLGLGLLVVLLAACSFRRSDPTDDNPGTGDASMNDGPAIDAAVDAAIDAPPDLCMMGGVSCTAAGGNCVNGTCVIDRAVAIAVTTCPTGMPCRVICNEQDACRPGVSCGGATSCEVQCTATNACQDGGVTCGTAGSCDVRCVGGNACKDRGVDCASTGTCTVRCEGDNACQSGAGGGNVSVECRDAMVCNVTCKGANNVCAEGIDDNAGGTCNAHCCDGACAGGVVASCMRDAVCM